jgi:hypothetical protein
VQSRDRNALLRADRRKHLPSFSAFMISLRGLHMGEGQERRLTQSVDLRLRRFECSCTGRGECNARASCGPFENRKSK